MESDAPSDPCQSLTLKVFLAWVGSLPPSDALRVADLVAAKAKSIKQGQKDAAMIAIARSIMRAPAQELEDWPCGARDGDPARRAPTCADAVITLEDGACNLNKGCGRPGVFSYQCEEHGVDILCDLMPRRDEYSMLDVARCEPWMLTLHVRGKVPRTKDGCARIHLRDSSYRRPNVLMYKGEKLWE